MVRMSVCVPYIVLPVKSSFFVTFKKLPKNRNNPTDEKTKDYSDKIKGQPILRDCFFDTIRFDGSANLWHNSGVIPFLDRITG